MSPRLTVVPASEVVGMNEDVRTAIRTKKDSSMRVAIDLVKEGRAHACVSAGNTGALMGTAKFVLKTLPGIDRPAICAVLPTRTGQVYALDLGANADCTPEHLLQFAIMGSTLVKAVEGKENPTVGLLNIGSEEMKGNEVVKKAGELLRRSPVNFHGNVEGDDIYKGTTDVVVCDGFAGNVALKTSEGLAKMLGDFLKEEYTRGVFSRLAALVSWPVIRRFRRRVDHRRYNGAAPPGPAGHRREEPRVRRPACVRHGALPRRIRGEPWPARAHRPGDRAAECARAPRPCRARPRWRPPDGRRLRRTVLAHHGHGQLPARARASQPRPRGAGRHHRRMDRGAHRHPRSGISRPTGNSRATSRCTRAAPRSPRRGVRPRTWTSSSSPLPRPTWSFPRARACCRRSWALSGGAAFDVQAVCAGFVYALATADLFIRAGQFRCALVVGAEVFSRILDWKDRSTCVLFGDGAGAVVLEASPQPGILSSHLHADGSYAGILNTPGHVAGGAIQGDPTLKMDGGAVFKLAVRVLEDSAREALAANGLGVSDVDAYIAHQANVRIISHVAKKLGISDARCIVTVDRHANTSAASIPLALDVAVRDGRVRQGHTVLLQGVGGGFTWGSVLLKY